MKIKLGVFFGGKSVEHEIAIITYTQALESINNDKYEVVPIYISKQGVLYTGEDLFDLENFKDMDVLLKRCYPVTIVNTGKTWEVVRVHPHLFSKKILNTIDVAFPIVHGTNCEDGTVAGYLNLLGIPYVGPDVLASSIGMDKILMKKVLKESGLPVVDYVAFYSSEYIKDEEKIQKLIAEKLRFPLIVKPGNLGSSVGIKKAKDENELLAIYTNTTYETPEQTLSMLEKDYYNNNTINVKSSNKTINDMDCTYIEYNNTTKGIDYVNHEYYYLFDKEENNYFYIKIKTNKSIEDYKELEDELINNVVLK